jgi:hypothetical protein
MNVCVCVSERTHLLICVYEWKRELTSRTHPRGYPDIEGYPDTEWYPLYWVIPNMDTPKKIPITLSDTHYGHAQENTHYSKWYPHPEWFFLSETVLTTHLRVHPLHGGTPSDTPDTEGVATVTWPSVGVKHNTWKSWGFGVLRDSWMFRARQQGAKHLALGCSWCRWKVLET